MGLRFGHGWPAGQGSPWYHGFPRPVGQARPETQVPDSSRWVNPVQRPAAGFTLVEVLLSIGIVSILLALVLPMIGHTRAAARSFRCQMALRGIAFDFVVFADRDLGPDRGADQGRADGRFHLETFVESLYGVDEFWRYGTSGVHTVPDASGGNPLRCPEVVGELTLRKNVPCSEGAISPPRNVSFGFNARLHRSVTPQGGATTVRLKPEVAERATMPLAWDIDGAEAERRDQLPHFSAPSLASEPVGPYADGTFWFPGARHGGRVNVALIGGQVVSTALPTEEDGWEWSLSNPQK